MVLMNVSTRHLGWIACLLFLSACVTPARRADVVRSPALVDLDGNRWDLDEVVARHQATLLVFWATGCPCVARYQRRIDELSRFHPEVAVVAVSSNADDDLATLRTLYPARSPLVPLAIDPGGRLADGVGAKSTPTAVVVDREGRIRYVGWIDNERQPGTEGRKPFVEEALSAVLEGREPALRNGPSWGCRITRSLGEDTRCSVP